MSIKALTRDEVIKLWPSGSDFTLTDLQTGTKIIARGSPPINYDHSDWQYKTKADYDTMMAIAGRSWTGRPCLLETASGCVSAVSVHTFNHSIVVASSAYNIVSPTLKRTVSGDTSTYGPGYERDKYGNWNPGSHQCMHYIDSYKLRSDTSYTRDMKAAVERAVQLANANGQVQDPTMPLLMNGSTGNYVKEVQTLINKYGYTPLLDTDGSFGTKTKLGVEWFQKLQGLSVTGMVTIDTWRALRAEDSEPSVDEQQTAGTGYKPSPWAKGDTDWAIKFGILAGTGGNNFDLQGPLTREQGVVLMHRFAARLGDVLSIDFEKAANDYAAKNNIKIPE